MFAVLQDWVSTQFSTSSGASGFAFLFLSGVLASLLPCVYPLYPITVSILRARQGSRGVAAHPLAYYAGMATVYGSFGIIAACTGGAANAALRSPEVNLGIGILLLLLGLATAGLLEFPALPNRLADTRDPRLTGTLLMGAGAGLLSSACVGPVVVGILVAIAANAGSIDLVAVFGASAKMFLFGLGLGLPVVLLGVFGLRLPRSGRWMLVLQWSFAILIAYFGIAYLGKALAAWGLDDRSARLLSAGAAVLGSAAFFLQPVDKALVERTRHALAVLAAAVGFLLMMAALPRSGAPVSDSESSPSDALVETHGDLRWYLDPEAAYAEAVRLGKPVFVDFYGAWCSNCKAFERLTLEDEQLHEALQRAVLLKIYDTAPSFAAYRDDPRFPELRVGLPFFLITTADGALLYKTSDYTDTDEMILFLSD